MAKELTRKQQLFVAEYLIDLNATRAAISAGYSKRTADKQGHQLLENPRIAEQISKKHGKTLQKLEISSERVLAELSKLAFYDPTAFFEYDGSLKQIKDLDPTTRMAIAGLEVTELFEGKDVPNGEQQKTVYGLLKKIKMTDKLRALELIGKHLKLFTDKIEHSGKVTLEGLVCGEVESDD